MLRHCRQKQQCCVCSQFFCCCRQIFCAFFLLVFFYWTWTHIITLHYLFYRGTRSLKAKIHYHTQGARANCDPIAFFPTSIKCYTKITSQLRTLAPAFHVNENWCYYNSRSIMRLMRTMGETKAAAAALHLLRISVEPGKKCFPFQ